MTLETDDSMGMTSVSQAPRWRHAGAAVRREPRLASHRSARLELVSADAARLSFVGRRAPIAPLLLCPLLLVLAGLPWLGRPPIDVVRAATSGAFLAASSVIATWAWPRRRRLSVVSKTVVDDPPNAQVLVAQPGKVRWVLDVEHSPSALSTTYTALLEPDDGGSFAVLQSADPGRLLWQFSEVLRHWPGPVDCRWGLPGAARPWNIEPHSGPHALDAGTEDTVIAVPLAHRPLVWCARIMAVLVVADLIVLVTSATRGLAVVHPLSVTLAFGLAGCLIALALGLGSSGWQLRIGSRVRREITLFGLRRAGRDVRLESVRGVYALGVASAERWHLLVDSADGPLVLPVPRRDAEALARDTERAIVLARSGR
jgi:hypothetical protein